mmetsp:Transcript_5951/g.8315  ORF Transcript_5951/g.8315 Transcript_5951/m.8315 type:complete len:240 (-) Transcript_5951:549-1268(-)
MVERANVSFVCLGIFCFILYIVVLAAPWFFLNEKLEDTGGNSAEVTYLFSWRDVYCKDSGAKNVSSCPDDQINWRDKCQEVFGGNCNDLEDTFNIAGGLSGLSFFFFLIGFVFVAVVNVAGKGPARLSIVAIIMYALATALLAAALIQFPIMFPDAFDKVYPCIPNDSPACPCSSTYDTNPCNMYMGTSNSNDDATGKYEFLWLSIGWIIAMFTCIIMIANTIQSIVGRRKGDADSDDY